MDSMKEAWDRYYDRNPFPWRGPNFDLPPFKRHSRVLDVGCGPGAMLVRGAEAGCNMVGMDLSGNSLRIARRKLDDRHLHADLIEGIYPQDALSLGRFDHILLHHVLSSMLLRERMEAVGAAREILNEKGSISFLDLSRGDMRYGSGELLEEGTFLKGNGIPEHFFTMGETASLFRDYRSEGLEEVTWEQRTRDGRRTRARISGTFYPV